MTREEARRPVSRLWLRAFAGIVAVLSAAPPAPAAGVPEEIAAVETHAKAKFAVEATQSSRDPVSVFLTDAGVYELDAAINSVRFWQRSNAGLELLRPKNGTAAVPYANPLGSGALRFSGLDADGNGRSFKQPVGMDLEPGGNRFAVVNAGEWLDLGLGGEFSPSVQVYSFTEETDSSGALSGVSVSFENEYKESFYTAVESSQYVMTGIVDTGYWTTNLLAVFYTTNWIHVISEDPPFAITNSTEAGADGIVVATNKWEEEVYHQQFTTNYEWRYTYTTNANYLSTATDVAFLGSEGVMVSITADERRNMPSGFLVFKLDDPSAKGALYPVTNLTGVIRKIAVDPDTGEVYASVPDAGAVYRFSPPGGGWLGFNQDLDIGVWQQDPVSPDPDFAAGSEGEQGAAFGKLSSPGDLSVWYSATEPDMVLLVADSANGRIVAFDYGGVPLFACHGTSARKFKAPAAVWGDSGADTFGVAEKSGRCVRIFEADLSGIDADSILSVSAVWPVFQTDLSVSGDIAFRDALHTNAVDSVAIVSVESDEGTNVLRFVVPPSRQDRTYTLSFEGGAGVLEAVSATTVVPAGETEGFFAVRAKDGIVNEDGSVPVYTAVVTAPSGETASATVAVLNARPVVVTAGMDGIPSMFGFITTAFSVDATDVEADAGLTYLWFATTNFNWGVNNLDWAATNHDWAAAATAEWSLLNGDDPAEMVVTNWVDWETSLWDDYDGRKHYYELVTNTASLFAPVATTEHGVRMTGVDVWVAKGKDVSVPAIFSYEGYPGMVIEDVVGRMGGIIVLTVLDKDGGATIVRFGTDYPSQDSAWTPFASGGGEHQNGAVYEGEFTDITPTYVSYVVRVKSGTPDAADTVTLKSSPDFRLDAGNEWKTVGTFFPARAMQNGSAFSTNAIQMSEGVLFYRVFQP